MLYCKASSSFLWEQSAGVFLHDRIQGPRAGADDLRLPLPLVIAVSPYCGFFSHPSQGHTYLRDVRSRPEKLRRNHLVRVSHLANGLGRGRADGGRVLSQCELGICVMRFSSYPHSCSVKPKLLQAARATCLLSCTPDCPDT